MTLRTVAVIAVVLMASLAPAALAQDGDASAYAGSSLSFEAGANGLVDYTVGGETVAESISVQSQSRADTALSLSAGADLGAVADVQSAALSLDASTDTRATVRSESGATLSAHDNRHGSLVVTSDGEAQYVEVGLGAEANAKAEGDGRVVVTNENGVQSAVLVVGEGDVAVNDEGNVTASVEGDGRVVVHSYPEGRDSDDGEQERLVQRGHAAASVYLTADGTDTVAYDDETAVEVTQRAEGRVSMAVERTSHDGKVVIANVADSTFESAEDVRVNVDGEAAVRASSYAELEQAAAGGDTSKFMISGQSRASASADVLVAVNHFSTRNVEMAESGSDGGGSDGAGDTDGASDTDGDGASGGDASGDGSGSGDGDSTGASTPGFGLVAAGVALLAGSALLVRYRL